MVAVLGGRARRRRSSPAARSTSGGAGSGSALLAVVGRRPPRRHRRHRRKTHLHLAEADGAIELDPDHSPKPVPDARRCCSRSGGMRRRAGVVTVRNIEFGEGLTRKGKKVRLRLDVTKPVDAKPGDKRPGILQIHGGALGHRRQARAGPPAAQPPRRQRLGRPSTPTTGCRPRSAAPEHLVDCKKAIAWWREHADEHGGDPDFLCVTGGSAGGHLTALVALTANDPRYQPGLRGRRHPGRRRRAVLRRLRLHQPGRPLAQGHASACFIEPMVMHEALADDPAAFADYSPIDQVRADAPPFFVIHGSLDTLAPVEDAREFVRLLRDVERVAGALRRDGRGPARVRDLPELPRRPGHRGRRAVPPLGAPRPPPGPRRSGDGVARRRRRGGRSAGADELEHVLVLF